MMNRKEERTFSRSRTLSVLLVVTMAIVLLAGKVGSLLASDLGLQEADCRCCHSSGMPDRHHLLTRTAALECLACHQMVWDDLSQSFNAVVTRDCLLCHTASLADRHHLSAKAAGTECLGCHQMTWDPVTQSYYLTFPTTCQPVPPLEDCTDTLDNDSNGLTDCNDPYCSGTAYCLPPQDEICTDGIDNDADTLVDCADPGCATEAACLPIPAEVCTDGIDNDGDALTDCADPDCAAEAACLPIPAEVCTDGIDNDGDALADCVDPDCAAEAVCLPIPAEICTDGIDNDGDALADCADPDCAGKPECPAPPPSDHYSHMAGSPSDCTGCHQKNLTDAHQKQCSLCHGATVRADVQAAVAAGNTSCLACHSPTVHLMQCGICHTSTPTSYSRASLHYGHTDNASCGICHAVPATVTLEPTGQYCKLCHGSARAYSSSSVPSLHYKHLRGRYYYPYSCQMCHGEAIPQTRPDQCNLCHTGRVYYESQLPAVHTNHRRLDCTTCHYDPRLLMLGDPADDCRRCHAKRQYSNPLSLHLAHSGMQCWSCHTFSEATARAGISCAGCHPDRLRSSYSAREAHYQHSSNPDGDRKKGRYFAGTPCSTCHSRVVPLLPPLNTSTTILSGSLLGTVTSTAGTPLAKVTVSSSSGYSAVTLADGSFRIDGISPGNFTFAASKSGYVVQSQPVSITAGAGTTVHFTLELRPNTSRFRHNAKDSAGDPAKSTGPIRSRPAMTAPLPPTIYSLAPRGAKSVASFFPAREGVFGRIFLV